MKRQTILALAMAGAIVAGCGDDTETTKSASATTASPAATTPAPEATETAQAAETPEAKAKGGCQTGNVTITISGGEGISCKAAKRIYRSYMKDAKSPKGWDCAIRACTDISGDEVRDFTWAATP